MFDIRRYLALNHLVFKIGLVAFLQNACLKEDKHQASEEIREVTGLNLCSVKSQGYFYVALIAPYTGPFASVAEAQELGVRLAVDQINSTGGIQDKPVGIIACDTQFDPARNDAVAKEIARASPVLGTLSLPGANLIGWNEFVSQKKVFIGAITSLAAIQQQSPDKTLEDVHQGYVFVLSEISTPAQVGKTLAYLALTLNYHKAFVISFKPISGTETVPPQADGFEQVFQEAGEQVQVFRFDASTQQNTFASDAVAAAMAYEPDLIVLLTRIPEAAAIIQQASLAAVEADWLLTPNLVIKDFLSLVKDEAYANGFMSFTLKPSKNFLKFKQQFNEYWGRDLVGFEQYSYDGAFALAIAAELATDPDNPEELKAKLHSIATGQEIAPGEWEQVLHSKSSGSVNYVGAGAGTYDFLPRGSVVANPQNLLLKLQNGAFVPDGCYNWKEHLIETCQ